MLTSAWMFALLAQCETLIMRAMRRGLARVHARAAIRVSLSFFFSLSFHGMTMISMCI